MPVKSWLDAISEGRTMSVKTGPAFSVTDQELQEELMWDNYCRQMEAQMRAPQWVVLAIPADLEAALMQEKARSVVH